MAESQMGSKKRRQSVKAQTLQTEQQIADDLGGKRVPMSGAGDKKGDVQIDDFVLDSKETLGDRLTLNASDFVKICREASQESKDPAFVFTFAKHAHTVPQQWVCIPFDKFAELFGDE